MSRRQFALPDRASSEPPDDTGSTGSTPGDDPFGWEEFVPGVETGLLDVPIDYDDPEAGSITSPLSPTQLGKFDTLTDVDRLYDNGNVRIYRMAQQ